MVICIYISFSFTKTLTLRMCVYCIDNNYCSFEKIQKYYIKTIFSFEQQHDDEHPCIQSCLEFKVCKQLYD